VATLTPGPTPSGRPGSSHRDRDIGPCPQCPTQDTPGPTANRLLRSTPCLARYL